MVISGMEKVTLLDYPGNIACIIFTQSCNFRCPFCQNAPLVVEKNNINIGEQEVLNYLNKRKKVLDGICISGGEPLLQYDLKNFIKEVKELGLKVKLDTNGSNPIKLKELLDEGLLDYVAMDIKNTFDKYDVITGIKNIDVDNIKKSIRIIQKSNVDHEFRTTLVKEFHELSDIKKICKFIGEESKYYLQNYRDSENVIKKGLHGFTNEELINFKESLQYPNLIIRGI